MGKLKSISISILAQPQGLIIFKLHFSILKLRYMDEWNEYRINVAKLYHSNISNEDVKLISNKFDGSHVYHLVIATSDNPSELMNHLEAHEVGFGRHYPIPIHHLECFKQFGWDKEKHPNAEYIAYNSISLPVFPGMSETEVELVTQAVNSFGSSSLRVAS